MNPDSILRRALGLSAGFNVIGGLAFAFPGSLLGAIAGMPSSAPLVYRAIVAWFVLLFAGVYAWLARVPVMNRPMVALAALGKGAVLPIVAAVWWAGEAPLRGVLLASGDAVFAAVFAWYLVASPASAAPNPV